MRKFIYLVLFFNFINLKSFAQTTEPKWHTFIEVDMIFPNQIEYNYFDTYMLSGYDVEFDREGFLLTSFGVQGSYNYHFLKRFSIGAVGGLQKFTSPSISMIKIGGVLRYYTANEALYMFLQVAHDESLSKKRFKNGTNVRMGIGLPLWRTDEFIVFGNINYDFHLLDLKGTKPLIGYAAEEPVDMVIKSLGISIGVKF